MMQKISLTLLLMLAAFTGAVHAAEALRVEGSTELYQRVLSLPGAELHRRADNGFQPREDWRIPVLTPFYVYERKVEGGEQWIAIGASPEGGPQGWIRAAHSEDWKHQLVMQYTPRGKRSRVLFFKDKNSLVNVISDNHVKSYSKELIDRIEKTGRAPQEVRAVEPWEAVDPVESPYLMPVFEHDEKQFSRGGNSKDTVLVKVAGVNTRSSVEDTGNEKLADPVGPASDPAGASPDLSDFRVGIVFVMDTTASMGPYIERTYETVKRIYGELEDNGDLERVSFGLVGYRDNTSPDPGIEYLTRVFQPLEPDADPADTLANLRRVKPASVPTRDWYEDTWAGLGVAVNEMDWEPFDLRMLVLVSDAGPRPPGDELASVSQEEVVAIRNRMQSQGITAMTLHLVTPEAKRAGDDRTAATAYKDALSGTGDPNQEKYLPIRGGSPEAFARQISALANNLSTAVHAAAQGRLAKSGGQQEEAPRRGRPEDAGDVLLNEIFRAQLEYLGRERGAAAPRFYEAWAAEHDLTDPHNKALDVRVLLTKNQINTLAARLEEIIPAMRAMDLDPREGWAKLVELSGRFSVDPGRQDFVEIGASGILPAYLQALPYKSRLLEMDLEEWLNLGVSGRNELQNAIEIKRLIYRDLAQDDRVWIDLGAEDPNLSVYPLRLADLP